MYLDGISITSRGHEWSNALLPLRDLQKLSMSDCDLSGPLDSSLTRLENLTVIVLGENNFSSPVPQTFANFKNLTTLNLRKCGLIDHSLSESLHSIILRNTIFFGTRPHTIGNMTNLFLLDLSHCQLYGTFPNSLSNLTHLTDLRLSHNDLYGSIPSYLFTLPSLERISLASNQFSKFDEFINVSSNVMEFLDLSSNNLSGPFPTSLFQFRSLFFLDLSSNRLNGSMQLDELLELRNLTDLTLSYNNISIIENDASVDQTAFPKLQTLYLASCNLQTFPRFLKNQSTLGYLNLSANQIQGVVPNWIWKLKSLSLLDISYNFLTELEGSLQNITSNLILIDLHNNQLQGSVSVFPESIECLDYSTNNFSGIPHDIGNYLSSTNFLSLSNNSLQGSIPHSLCKASNLLVLDLSFNNILGTISPCLITMTSILEALNLRNNNLNGSIPDTFPTSCVVNFHANLLHGPIPKSLSHCSSLKVLDIGSNQIVGGFPCFLKHIPTLSVLVLRNNRLHGSIECSHSLENKPWKMIQIVDIALNNFNGKIPEKYFMTWERMMHDENDSISDFIYSMGKNFYSYYQDSVTVSNKVCKLVLPFLFEPILQSFGGEDPNSEGQVIGLDLSEEDISDGFDNSSSLFSLEHLQKLNLAYNLFETVIPSGFNKLVMLNYLNFSHSSFKGEIPVEISNLTNLITLDISGPKHAIKNALKINNQNLQKFVQNLTKIRQLYLEDITLTSEGQEWSNALLPLRELQMLSLYKCDLAGPLDSSLSKLRNLSVIILDRNNFSSPVPETFANFQNLTTLSLSDCGLTGTFPQKIFQIGTLSVIDITYNSNLHGSFPEIQLSGSLQTLRVSFTNFSGAIPHIIGKMRHLYELDLSNSQFNGTLPNSFSNLTELSYLDLSFNSFTGPIPSFSMAKNLNHIDLSYNSLSGEVSSSFHSEGLLNLVKLDLSFNSINGSISSFLFTLPYL
ncbi:receptor like protein 23 [Medicago truncatula]|nr:receptor like protein 23 [Medicago truncatula]